MSSYMDTYETIFAGSLKGGSRGEAKVVEGYVHIWSDFTKARLKFLYGPNYAAERAAKTAADLAAWRALGEPKGRAA